MIDKESFDVISGLNCCKNNEEYDTAKFCGDCEFASYGQDCQIMLFDKSIDLIKQKNAEIERLEDLVAEKQNLAYQWRDNVEELLIEIQTAKAEAVKEFAERLKGFERRMYPLFDDPIIDCKDIDNLVKEMVGDTE